jgi:hypothetical protein
MSGYYSVWKGQAGHMLLESPKNGSKRLSGPYLSEDAAFDAFYDESLLVRPHKPFFAMSDVELEQLCLGS